jgi:hypothetical protein
MSLKAMIEQAAQNKKVAQETGIVTLEPFVAPQHARWVTQPEALQAFTPAAIARGVEVMQGMAKAERSNRFSASGLDHCPRRQIFSFMGLRQTPPDIQGADIMRSGTAAHFWIMMEGLSAGWLLEAEVFYRDDHYSLGGTLDGVLSDASIWEYKSVSANVFRDVTTSTEQSFIDSEEKTMGPKFGHRLQLEAYELLTGMDLKSLFYQHRDYGAYKEYRLGHDEPVRVKLITLLEKLNGHIEDNTLPPMYDSCERGTGDVFKKCPFKDVCPMTKRVRP